MFFLGAASNLIPFSSIRFKASFLHFIVIFLLHEDEINSADDDTISQIIQKIKVEFEQIDELALNNQENWWPIILEQIETGMM